MLIIKNGNDLALLVPWIPQSHTCNPAGLQGAVIVTNAIRESGTDLILHTAIEVRGHRALPNSDPGDLPSLTSVLCCTDRPHDTTCDLQF